MKSSANPSANGSGILRGAEVSGVVFCTPTGEMETQEDREEQDQQNLKALEQYWHTKGLKEGHQKGFDEGFQDGLKEGQRKGLQEGLEKGREEGLSEGKNQGLNEGLEKSQQELDQALSVVNALSTQLKEETESLLGKNHSELIRFTLCVCERILKRELSQKESLQSLLDMLFEQAGSILQGQRIEVSLNPEDFAILDGDLELLTIDPQLKERLILIADPSLVRGNCRLDTELGLLNFDIQRQLDSLEKRLLELCEGEVSSETEEEHAEAGQGD